MGQIIRKRRRARYEKGKMVNEEERETRDKKRD